MSTPTHRGRRRARLKLFPTDMPPRERRVYGAAAAFFALAFAALVWPAYVPFSGVTPRVLGLPLSLAWVILWLALSFLALLALFLWEGGRDAGGGRGPGEPGPRDGRAGPGGR